MMKYGFAAALILFANSAAAHELTPTYPEIEPSYVEGVSVIKMKMWNRRSDASYYEINVYDDKWKSVPFAAPEKVIKLGYLEHKSFELYVRDDDIDRVTYICTTSKQLKQDVQSTGIKSRICSRVK
jgi:hypothetical protein